MLIASSIIPSKTQSVKWVVVIPVIKTIIKQNKVSSLKIDGEKIEVTNVSQELIESILKKNEEKEAKNKKRSKG